MTVLYIALTGFLNIACFIIGAKVGQTVSKGEKVEIPNLNPLKAYRDKEARKAQEIKQNKLNTIKNNIDCYDGTSKGQQDVG